MKTILSVKNSKAPLTGEKYALVTGASDRIGRGIALELATMGYHLVLHYRSSLEKAEQVKAEVEQLGQKAILVQFDFLVDNDFDRLFLDWHRQDIAIQVVVNNASEYSPSGLDGLGRGMLDRQLRSNFEGAYLLTKAFDRVFGTGVIINMLDTKIKRDHTTHLDYILAKKLLAEFTKIAAVELAPAIRVNGVCPGLILPPADKDETYLLGLAEQIPLRKIGGIEDIQRAVRFLVESTFITGQLLYIDGGEHLSI